MRVMKKIQAILLFAAIGLVLTIFSSVVGYYIHDNSCSDNPDPTCELGPPNTRFGLPLHYLDSYDAGYPIAFEPHNIIELYDRVFVTSGYIDWLSFIGNTIFWGLVSWLIYLFGHGKRIKKPKL